MAVAHPLWQEQVESAELPPGPVEPLGQAVHVDEPCIAAQNQAPAALAPLLPLAPPQLSLLLLISCAFKIYEL